MERDNETLDWKKNEKERDKRMSTARANTFYNHCTYSDSVQIVSISEFEIILRNCEDLIRKYHFS